jgi:hypothetical protein
MLRAMIRYPALYYNFIRKYSWMQQSILFPCGVDNTWGKYLLIRQPMNGIEGSKHLTTAGLGRN